jgi:predicted nucleic acid-binding Zn ribbon protein
LSDKDFRKPSNISSVVPSVLASLGIKKSCDGWRIVELWPEIVGGDIADQATAVRFSDGILYVLVPRDVWRQELHLQRDLILQKIHSLPFGKAVKEIRLLGSERGH